ncbi:hypothetical protein BT69DRAFT_1338896 [Atractiella rhizophila]|nr:hypothetical protein BT69DRAFT_1338896 [Atractiella rhizophila]
MVLGYETAGLVVTGTSPSPLPPLIRLAKQSHALGPKISLHKKGYCVALEPGEIYRTFYDCKVGKSELWPSVEFLAYSRCPPITTLPPAALSRFSMLPASLLTFAAEARKQESSARVSVGRKRRRGSPVSAILRQSQYPFRPIPLPVTPRVGSLATASLSPHLRAPLATHHPSFLQ